MSRKICQYMEQSQNISQREEQGTCDCKLLALINFYLISIFLISANGRTLPSAHTNAFINATSVMGMMVCVPALDTTTFCTDTNLPYLALAVYCSLVFGFCQLFSSSTNIRRCIFKILTFNSHQFIHINKEFRA